MEANRKMTMHRTLAALAVGVLMLAGAALPALAAGVRLTVNDTPITDVQIGQRASVARAPRGQISPGNT